MAIAVPQAAANATMSAAGSPKNHAQTAVTIVARASMPNSMPCGDAERSSEPMAMATTPPAAAAPTMAPSATFSDTPGKWSERSRNARKKIM